MSRRDKWIGFDRRLELSWLDLAASKVAAGASPDELRDDLLSFLQSLSNDPAESGSARPKTIRVILRIWGSPEAELEGFNASCAELFPSSDADARLALHWAMTLAAYPYFHAHAHIIGRMLALQDTVSAAQIRRRIAEKWGDRSTVHRTSRHVVRTMVAWGVLSEAGKGEYRPAPRRPLIAGDGARNLFHAVLLNTRGKAVPWEQLLKHPALFPFDIQLGVRELERGGEIAVAQEGVGTVMVGLRTGAPYASRSC